jgi:hypothetical protein
MNATEMNSPHSGKLHVTCAGADAGLIGKQGEHALNLFINCAWGGWPIRFPPCRGFFNLSGRAMGYLY